MSYFFIIIKAALFDFSRNKMRTILTSLGILIGVSSVILLLAFGVGLRVYISDQFESLGSNLLIVYPGSFTGASFRPGSLGATKFDELDQQKLQRINNSIAVGVFTKTITVSGGTEEKLTDIFATTEEIFPVRNFEAEYGRIFTKADVEKRAKVAVLGPNIAKDLYGSPERAIGKIIKLSNVAYQVIGVLVAKGGGGFGGPSFDDYLYVPYTAVTQFNPTKTFLTFYLKAETKEDIEPIKAEATRILLQRYKQDEFSLVESTEILSSITSIFSMINLILVAIGAISLVVGGVGIMNIMYVSVTERIKEIGIRRAVGATRKDILVQFLTESVILSLIGGVAGLLLSGLIVLGIRQVFPATIEPLTVVIAIGVSSLVGIIFGVFPAKKAADLSPIEAIRYE